MTTQEKIAVLTAFEEGKQVEYRFGSFGEWMNCPDPVWNFGSCDYRAKPEPPKKTWRATLDNGYVTSSQYDTLEELLKFLRYDPRKPLKLELVDAR